MDGGSKLVVSGGYDVNSTLMSSTSEILDLNTLTWTDGPDLPQQLGYGASVQFQDTFLAIGGSGNSGLTDTIYQYDYTNNVWIERSEKIPTKGLYKAIFLVPDEAVNCSA